MTEPRDLSQMSDEEFARFAEDHWTNHQQVIRGNSNRAIDNSWALFDQIRAEKARRAALKKES